MRISATSLQRYLQCPFLYKTVKDGFRSEDQPVYLTYGTLIHESIEEALLSKDIDNIETYLDKHWADSKINDLAFYNKSKNAIIAFKYYFEQIKGELLGVELEFDDYKINDSVSLTGKVDQLYSLDNGSFKIVDVKTGNFTKTSEQLNNDIQLSIYDLVVSKMYNQDKIETALFYCEKGEVTPDPPDRLQYNRDYFEDFLTVSCEKIESAKEFPATINQFCSYCQCKEICSEYKNVYYCEDSDIQNEEDAIKKIVNLRNKIKILDKQKEDAEEILKIFMKDNNNEKISTSCGSASMIQKQTKVYNTKKVLDICKENNINFNCLKISSELVDKILKKNAELKNELDDALFVKYSDPYLVIKEPK